MKKQLISLLLALALALSLVPAAYADQGFTDVKTGDYFYDAVMWAKSAGVTTGATVTTFGPNGTCTRGQVVTFLWRALGEPAPKTQANPFTDVPTKEYYYKPVLWAVEQGITTGTTATTFSPNQNCTNAQVVTFLWRALGKPEASASGTIAAAYKDGEYYKSAVAWADTNGLFAPSGTPFVWDSDAPRRDIVTYLYLTFGDASSKSVYTKGTLIAPARSRDDMEPDYHLSDPAGTSFQKLDSATGNLFSHQRSGANFKVYTYSSDLSLEEVTAELRAYVDLLLGQGNFRSVVPFGLNQYVGRRTEHYSAVLRYTGTAPMKGNSISAYTDEVHHLEIYLDESYREITVDFDANLTMVDAGLRTPAGAKLLSARQVSGDRAGDAYYKDGAVYYNASDKKLSAASGSCALLIDGRSCTGKATFTCSSNKSTDRLSVSGYYEEDAITLMFVADKPRSGDVYPMGQLATGYKETDRWADPSIELCYNRPSSRYTTFISPKSELDPAVPEATIRILRWDKTGDTVVYFHMKARVDGTFHDIEGLIVAPWTDPEAKAPSGSSSSGGSLDFPEETSSPGHLTCSFCHGEGERDCGSCDGVGFLYERKSVPDYSGKGTNWYTEKTICTKCHGTGKVTCIYCGGDGYVGS